MTKYIDNLLKWTRFIHDVANQKNNNNKHANNPDGQVTIQNSIHFRTGQT